MSELAALRELCAKKDAQIEALELAAQRRTDLAASSAEVFTTRMIELEGLHTEVDDLRAKLQQVRDLGVEKLTVYLDAAGTNTAADREVLEGLRDGLRYVLDAVDLFAADRER